MTTEHETVGDVLADMRHPFYKESAGHFADRIERAHARESAAQVGVPEGFALVPREPTQAMLTVLRFGDNIDNRKTYSALLSAAPAPAAEPDPKPAAEGDALDAIMRARGLPKVADALGYSRNFASANPTLSQTTRDHIEGLCEMLEIAAAHPSPEPPPAEPATVVPRLDVLHDADAGMYVATSPDVPGLVVEASTREDLRREAALAAAQLRTSSPLARSIADELCRLSTTVPGEAANVMLLAAAAINVKAAPQPAPSDAPASPQAAQGDVVAWLLGIMGDYDFTMPTAAFEKISRRLASAQPATAKPAAEFKVGDRVEWDSGCGKLAATIRGYSLDIDDSGFVDCVHASSLTRLTGGSHD